MEQEVKSDSIVCEILMWALSNNKPQILHSKPMLIRVLRFTKNAYKAVIHKNVTAQFFCFATCLTDVLKKLKIALTLPLFPV